MRFLVFVLVTYKANSLIFIKDIACKASNKTVHNFSCNLRKTSHFNTILSIKVFVELPINKASVSFVVL
jgi:hypothetical protein